MNLIPEEQSDLSPFCLQYRLPKNISRQEEQMTSHDWGERDNVPVNSCGLLEIVSTCIRK